MRPHSLTRIFTIILCLTPLLCGLQSAHAEDVQRVVPESNMQKILSFSPLVKKASPAVVNIYSTQTVKVDQSPLFSDPFFGNLFGKNLFGDMQRDRVERSLGSGVIISSSGLVVTNKHVVGNKNAKITVVLSDRREFPAEIALVDEKADLALLRIQGLDERLPYLELGDSDGIEVGDMVLAIGDPFGVGQTVTSGIISAVARTTVGVSDYRSFIQTDAAINPGNSGGALLDMNGRVIGINTAIYTRSGGSNGIGFATPANMVKAVIKSLETGGKVIRPWLGVTTQNVTQDIAKSIGLERPVGAIVTAISKGSPAAQAGMKVGDVITAVDGHDVLDSQALRFRIATYNVGIYANISVLRNGNRRNIPVQMAPPPEKPKRDLRNLVGTQPFAGATVGNLSPALADELSMNITSGVVITDIKGGIASRIGFKRGDIILQVNGTDIGSTLQLVQATSSDHPTWNIIFQRDGKKFNITVR